MTALSARQWPLGAGKRRCLLLALLLAALMNNAAAQSIATTAVPPSYAVQPLYGEQEYAMQLLADSGMRKQQQLNPAFCLVDE